jgi:ABC-type sugar transport system ATPase subunit
VTCLTLPLLELEGISKTFPGVNALVDVNLAADRGEVHALVGANGAGKSTLIAILSGVFQSTSGVMRLAGREVIFRSPRMAREGGISTVYQEMTMLPELTVGENIFLSREPRTRWGLVDFARLYGDAAALIERYGLAINPKDKVGRLGIAHRQQVELARALSSASQILILDEPTAVLAPAEQTMLFKIIDGLKRAGLLIIYVSHRLEEIFSIGDRVSVLRDGRHVATVPISSIDHHHLVRLMVGHDVRDRFNLPKVESRTPVLSANIRTRGGESRLVLHRGEILGLAGVLGSGRTRIARALVGIAKEATATAEIGGKTIKLATPGISIGAGIYYLTEDRKTDGSFANLSVITNTSAGALERFTVAGFLRPRRERRETASILESLNLVARSLAISAAKLSGGNQQKVLFGRALLCRPKVLICDEPTRGIDVGAKDQIYDILIRLAQQGLGVILISSELKELLALSHRLLFVDRGRIDRELPTRFSEHELLLLLAGTAERHGRSSVGETVAVNG